MDGLPPGDLAALLAGWPKALEEVLQAQSGDDKKINIDFVRSFLSSKSYETTLKCFKIAQEASNKKLENAKAPTRESLKCLERTLAALNEDPEASCGLDPDELQQLLTLLSSPHLHSILRICDRVVTGQYANFDADTSIPASGEGVVEGVASPPVAAVPTDDVLPTSTESTTAQEDKVDEVKISFIEKKDNAVILKSREGAWSRCGVNVVRCTSGTFRIAMLDVDAVHPVIAEHLRIAYELAEINDNPTKGREPDYLASICRSQQTNVLKFVPPKAEFVGYDEVPGGSTILRSMIQYVPEDDEYVGHASLALRLSKGTLFYVTTWAAKSVFWTGRLVNPATGEPTGVTGLIPSTSHAEEMFSGRVSATHSDELAAHSPRTKRKKSRFLGIVPRSRKSKSDSLLKAEDALHGKSNDEVLLDSEHAYEQVVWNDPVGKETRPVVFCLVGPKNVGRKEIRANLIKDYPTVFSTPVHVTLPALGGVDTATVNGKGAGSNQKKGTAAFRSTFRDKGKKSMNTSEPSAAFDLDGYIEVFPEAQPPYGITVDSLIRATESGVKACLYNCDITTAIKLRKRTDIDCAIVFVTTPTIEVLKRLRPGVPTDILCKLPNECAEMRATFEQYFDFSITNAVLEDSLTSFINLVTKMSECGRFIPMPHTHPKRTYKNGSFVSPDAASSRNHHDGDVP
eukprot:Clim_evm63s146 gene=Clim_evmTU63s146